jgi:hypothetical protein
MFLLSFQYWNLNIYIIHFVIFYGNLWVCRVVIFYGNLWVCRGRGKGVEDSGGKGVEDSGGKGVEDSGGKCYFVHLVQMRRVRNNQYSSYCIWIDINLGGDVYELRWFFSMFSLSISHNMFFFNYLCPCLMVEIKRISIFLLMPVF